VCKANVYVHYKDADTGARVTHIDIECPELNDYIKPHEKTFAGGKKGGVFIGMKKNQINRTK
jgi:hypothetical protein